MKHVFMTWIIPTLKLPVMSQVSHLENTQNEYLVGKIIESFEW